MEAGVTVACVLNVGNDCEYDLKWVFKLKNMVDRNMTAPYEFICLNNVYSFDYTDDSNIRFVPLLYNDDLPRWWAKMELFRSSFVTEYQRILYLDLDLVIIKDLKDIIDFPASFAIASAFSPPTRRHYHIIYGYNSSVMVFNREAAIEIWRTFCPNSLIAKGFVEKYRGDQDWLKAKFPELDLLPQRWVAKLANCITRRNKLKIPETARVLLCMPGKNIRAARLYSEIKELWQ